MSNLAVEDVKSVEKFILRPEEAGISYRLSIGPEKKALIGIRRYGGKYCSACEVSLLKDGEEAAVYAGKVHCEKCPLCEKNDHVIECVCFEWRMAPHRLNRDNVQLLQVVDSFGQTQSVKDFLVQIRRYPIQYYDKIEK